MPKRPYAGLVMDSLKQGMKLYTPTKRRVLIKGPEDMAEHLKPLLEKADREVFLTVILNARNQVVTTLVISIGSLNASIVHPREVFKNAIKLNAAALILCHNHPSGETDPSDDDIALTRRLVQVGDLCGIAVMDHIIVGTNGFTSLKQQGYM
jgi:DNA repair protein RadC